MVEKQTIQKFIENLKSQSRNILGTFHIKSYLGMESLPFLSDHAAWQEMLSEPYWDQDDVAKQSSLRCTEASTRNAIQFWQLIPAGFGIFFNIWSGQQWVIIATPNHSKHECNADYFTQWDRYLQDSDPMNPTSAVDTTLEAIWLEPWNCL
jgi:hypothetical protein